MGTFQKAYLVLPAKALYSENRFHFSAITWSDGTQTSPGAGVNQGVLMGFPYPGNPILCKGRSYIVHLLFWGCLFYQVIIIVIVVIQRNV